MTEPIAQGTSTSHGDTHTLRFALFLPYAMTRVWGAVATPVGLRQWLAAAEVFESRLGGRVALRGPDMPEAAAGTLTAWDGERVAEYTFAGHGRVRFHLESVGAEATVVRFTHEFTGPGDRRPDALACWHEHFELLHDALEGHPRFPPDGPAGNRERRQELRAAYRPRGGRHS
ncbi:MULTISPECIES: SRPBCC domain-containing protein [unclassified Streptomyces]|uniref:SRPBCC domain-containing protein n=1 Tax=unclassified Streptomyces TaxID=2593676 RepID=UPI002E117416|nr:SRPBCC domain-containing protein [Streptomyces sp. NBC_01197]WSS50894.1 SRPBCC domain-containing protein [Streptomyces sp. NBC_01180]